MDRPNHLADGPVQLLDVLRELAESLAGGIENDGKSENGIPLLTKKDFKVNHFVKSLRMIIEELLDLCPGEGLLLFSHIPPFDFFICRPGPYV